MQAQSGISLASLQIELWPEFDRPATLVILDGRLDERVSLPVELTLRIPVGAGQPHAVAVRGAKGELLNAPYTTTRLEDELAIVFQADSAEFRVEYYDPGLALQGSQRDYTFNWLTDYSIQSVGVRVQQPANATNLTLGPDFTSAGTGEYGLTYHQAAFGALAGGQPLTVQFSYQKSTASLSVETVGVAPSTTDTAAPPVTSRSPWLVGGAAAGTLLVLGGIVWYVWSGTRPRPRRPAARASLAQRHPRRRRPSEPAAVTPLASGSTAARRFCTQCGQPAEAADQFCRQCGTRLRS